MEAVKKDFETAAADISSGKVSNVSQDEQLELYGLYSVVRKGVAPTEGPSAWLDPTGFAKWTAWSSVSHLTTQEAMQHYSELVQELSSRKLDNPKQSSSHEFGSKFSTGFDISADETEQGDMVHDICYWATIGDIKSVNKCLQTKRYSANYRDQDGLTPLMRAVDRNEEQIVDILMDAKAEINATDNEGQTALHYAVYCEHSEMAALLVSYGASCDIKDSDGMSPLDAATGETKQCIELAQKGLWVRQTKLASNETSIWDRLQAISNSYHTKVVLTVSALVITGFIVQRNWRR